MAAREEMAGLYPDPDDPEFPARLYTKREFYEARAITAGVAEGTIDPCSSKEAQRVFELTPVQRIVSRFMHPLTPYMGMLLFHGVGVGKTCSAVTIAEQFLEVSPTSQVIIVAPQAIQDNFKRTIFDPDKISWDEAAGQWTSNQCTGMSYLERLGIANDRDLLKNGGVRKIATERMQHYQIVGYQAFANYIERNLQRSVPPSLEDREAAENEVLRRMFSNKLIIIDEAHNMRDIAVGEGDALRGTDAAENAGGKALNPFLKRIVLNAEGLRLVLMTATPMYNSAPEIVLLLSFLYMNDRKTRNSELKPSNFFTAEGELMPAKAVLLEKLARRYVSYMRGENPYTFPLRMRPLESLAVRASSMWEGVASATKKPVDLYGADSATLDSLPLVFTTPVEGSIMETTMRSSGGLVEDEDEPEGSTMLDTRMQIANMIYPDSTYGTRGWEGYFTATYDTTTVNKLRQFTPVEGFDVDSVFRERLRDHAPKIHRVVESVTRAKGICFVYTRYVRAGLLPLAAALERAGFRRCMKDGRKVPLLTGVTPVDPVCAICGERKTGHDAVAHTFREACYVMLTSESDLCPKIDDLVRLSTTFDGEDDAIGGRVKVILGSQVASEGLDLKCIRELHILDSWYHLNRTDQIIGRAIRYCSHAALRAVEERQRLEPMALNNCLIYLHVMSVAGMETADMYAYRVAIRKAQKVGRVQRLLKRHAWDCNLELEAITFAGLPLRVQVDAQGNTRRSRNEEGEELDGYSIDDQNYTTYCDYQVCEHQCAITIAANPPLDMSTFGIMDARRIILAKQSVIRSLFADQVMIPETVVKDVFADLPWEIASEALMELIDGRLFRLRRPDGVEGFLVKKAGYLVFQPAAVTDTDIPIALRYARAFQLRRHFMDVRLPVLGGRPAFTEAEAEAAPVATSLDRWKEWIAFVDADREEAVAIPTSLNISTVTRQPLHIWAWLLSHFEGATGLRRVALRWWFDMIASHKEKRQILEAAIAGEESDGLTEDIYSTDDFMAYRLFNPATDTIEIFCNRDGRFELCMEEESAIVLEALDRLVDLEKRGRLGTIIGFLGWKKGGLIFKSLDMDPTKKISNKSKGVECGRAPNMVGHKERVVALQAAARETALGPYMLDETAPVDKVASDARKGRLEPENILELTHQPLCMYMEFLTRIMDMQGSPASVGGGATATTKPKRWFVNICDAVRSGIKDKR